VVSDQETAAFYDEFVDYQLHSLRDPNRRLRRVQEHLRPLLNSRPRAALDIGCGIGITSCWLAEQIPTVVGVDISPRSIEVARQLYTRPQFEVCAPPRDPFPGGAYDLIVLIDVLEHFPPGSLPAVFRRINQVASQDAVVAVNMPSKLFALRGTSAQLIDEAVNFGEVVSASAEIGMEPLRVSRYGVEYTNQYVFATLSRSYDVSSPLRSSVREWVEDRVWLLRMTRANRKPPHREKAG
jgi:SAM-dependent methyltransferase